MQAINGNKLLHHLERVSGDFRPITADIFLTNYCNNKCSFCTYNRWEHDKNAVSMSYVDFVKYASRLQDLGVKGFILTGGGEPTINIDFGRITRYLEEKNIPYGINTNFNKLVYCKPEYLKISLDGYNEESYEKARKVRSYEKVRENIFKYAEWKKINSPGTNLGIQMIVLNYEDVLRFYDANQDLPVDYIVFRPIESTRGEFYKSQANKDGAEKAVDIIKKLADDDERIILNFKWEFLKTGFDSCVAHWSQIAIDEKGNVIYCCHKPYEKIGHITDPDILEKHRKAVTNMAMCDIPCRLTSPNLFMEKVKEKVENVNFI